MLNKKLINYNIQLIVILIFRNGIILVPILLLYFKGTAQIIENHQFYDNQIRVDSNNVPFDSSVYYIPPSIFNGRDTCARCKAKFAYLNGVFSDYLYSMKEPLLYNKPLPNNFCRLTFLKNRGCCCFAFKAEYVGNKGILNSNVFGNEYCNDFGVKLCRNLIVNDYFNKRQEKLLNKIIDETKEIYQMPKKRFKKTFWLFECVVDNHYYVFLGHPPVNRKFKRFFNFLISPVCKNKKII